MSKHLKRQLSIVLSFVMLLSFCVGTGINAKAASTEGGTFYISNITDTTADADWSVLVDEYAANEEYIDSFDVSLKVDDNEKVLATGTTTVTGQLYNLVPGTIYSLIVKPNYHYFTYNEATDQKDLPVYEQGYEFAVFLTTGMNPASTTMAPATTQAPVAQAPVVTTQVPAAPAPAVTAPQTPKISKATMVDDDVAIVANTVTAYGYEFRVCNKKTGKTVATKDSNRTGTYFYDVAANKTYYAQVRSYVYDANYNKVYSAWSAKKYFIAQPTVNKNKTKISTHSIKMKWNKITGAKNYTVYIRKSGTKKWTKVKTVKGTSYTVTKFKGRGINTYSSDYNVCVVANAKIGKKKIKSDNGKYLYTYTTYGAGEASLKATDKMK